MLLRRETVVAAMRHAHGQQVQPEAFELEDALGGRQELHLEAEGRAVLLVEFDQTLGAVQSDLLPAMPPERRVEAAVEAGALGEDDEVARERPGIVSGE